MVDASNLDEDVTMLMDVSSKIGVKISCCLKKSQDD